MRRIWPLLLFAAILPACEIASSGFDEEPPPESTLSLPMTTGPFRVASTAILVVDEDRDDEYTPEVDVRELPVRLGYPTDQEGLESVRYMHPTVAELIASTQDYLPPADMVDKVSRVSSRITSGAPVSSVVPELPVVFWSHGLGGVADLQTTFAAELASHGFLVVGIDHTYGAFASVFPDGTIKSIRAGSNAPEFPVVVNIWARDMASVLDHLEGLNASDPSGLLTGRIDVTRVGAIGHSTGGSATAEILTFDARFAAGITLDAPQVGPAAEGAGVEAPLMLFFAEQSDYASDAVAGRLQGPGWSLDVAGTTHYSFTDLPVLLELAEVPDKARQASNRPPGTLDAYRNLQIINDWTLAFFDRFLRGGAAPLLDGTGGLYPEVTARRVGVVSRAGI